MKALLVALSSLALALTASVAAAPLEVPAVAVLQTPPKPSGPIDLRFRVANAALAGQLVDIEIVARAADVEAWRLETAVARSDELIVTSSAVAEELIDGRRWIVTVVPQAADTVYLTVVVTGRIDGLEQSRSVVVPIRTTAAAHAAPERAIEITEDERLILLPVEELAAPPR